MASLLNKGDDNIFPHGEFNNNLGAEDEDLPDSLGELLDSFEATDLTKAYQNECDLNWYLDSIDLTASEPNGTPYGNTIMDTDSPSCHNPLSE